MRVTMQTDPEMKRKKSYLLVIFSILLAGLGAFFSGLILIDTFRNGFTTKEAEKMCSWAKLNQRKWWNKCYESLQRCLCQIDMTHRWIDNVALSTDRYFIYSIKLNWRHFTTLFARGRKTVLLSRNAPKKTVNSSSGSLTSIQYCLHHYTLFGN